MSLARKLVGPQLLILAAIVGLLLAQLAVAHSERAQLEATSRRLQQTGLRIARIGELFGDTQRDLLSEYVTRRDVLTRRILQSNEEIDALLDQLPAVDWTSQGRVLLEDLRRMRKPLVAAERALLESPSGPVGRGAFFRWWLLDQRANAVLTDLTADNLRGVDRILARVARTRERSDLLMLIVTVLCALAVAATTLYVFRGVVAPLVQLTRASRRASEGEIVPRLPRREDELGMLSRALAETTERLVNTNADLQSALAARDRFISVAAHELRTPLTSLSLQISLFERRLDQGADREALRRTLDALDRQADRLVQLVGELLDVTRIQAGRLELHREPVILSTLVREVCSRCAPLLESGQNRLTLALEEGVVCDVDPSRLEQVLVNLLANAARHAHGSPIEVAVWGTDDGARLRVRDSGPGISESVRAQLFERFARAPGATPGLGLGLYIAREIVDAHGGRIEVESARERGTTFTVHLPRAPSIPAAVPA